MSGTRVGLLCGYLNPERDGVADYTRRLAVHLRAAGLEAVLITTHEWASAAGDGAVGVSDHWQVSGVVAAAQALRRLDLDVLHVQFAPSVFGFTRAVGLLPLLLPRHLPLVVTLHEYGVWSANRPGRRTRSRLWSAAEHRCYIDRETLLLVPRATRLLVPSPEHLDVLASRFPRHPRPVREAPIGMNIDVPPVGLAEARAAVRDELGATPEAPVIAFFGFLHPEKALDRLIMAAGSVAEQWPDVQLLLIGGLESHSVDKAAAHRLRADLQQVSAACGIPNQVHFTGHVPDVEVFRLLQAADVAAFPFNAGVTRKSGSLLAAFAAGVPVVATAPPGQVREPMEADGVLRVPPRDTDSLAEALRRVLSDRILAHRLTAAGRAVAAGHSWDAIAALHARVYAQALTDASGVFRRQVRPDLAG